jgi:hypothetical protein
MRPRPFALAFEAHRFRGPTLSHMKNFHFDTPLDLIEVRRQLTAMRSLHSNDPRITTAINRLLGKLAHLNQPENRRHEEQLLKIIAKTLQHIDEILSNGPEEPG